MIVVKDKLNSANIKFKSITDSSNTYLVEANVEIIEGVAKKFNGTVTDEKGTHKVYFSGTDTNPNFTYSEISGRDEITALTDVVMDFIEGVKSNVVANPIVL